MRKGIIASILALVLGVCLTACGESMEEKSAVEAGTESTECESNQEESVEAEEVAAEVTPETEEEVTAENEKTAEVEKTEEELTAEAEEMGEDQLTEVWDPQDYESENLSIVFGSYEQDNNLDNGAEPLEWNVIKEEDGKVLLICKYGIEAMQYHPSEDDVTWETCSLRQWLNHDFIDTAFDDEKVDNV